jgi:hypothetical protein
MQQNRRNFHLMTVTVFQISKKGKEGVRTQLLFLKIIRNQFITRQIKGKRIL